jgi:hypothetical protein
LIPAGIPLSVGALYNYSFGKGLGAILMTGEEVVKDSVYHREPYKIWCKLNAKRILQLWPDVKRRGFWIITETWSSSKASIYAQRDYEGEVSIGFDVSAVGIGETGPSGSWYKAESDSGWISPVVNRVGHTRSTCRE